MLLVDRFNTLMVGVLVLGLCGGQMLALHAPPFLWVIYLVALVAYVAFISSRLSRLDMILARIRGSEGDDDDISGGGTPNSPPRAVGFPGSPDDHRGNP
jgi:hypothetical protein